MLLREALNKKQILTVMFGMTALLMKIAVLPFHCPVFSLSPAHHCDPSVLMSVHHLPSSITQ